jgi:hypothetical protein
MDAAQPPPAIARPADVNDAQAQQPPATQASPPPFAASNLARPRTMMIASPARDSPRDQSAPLELGVGTFLMSGGSAGSYVGVAPFLIDDVGQAVFLRPSVALGTSLATNLPSTWAAARLDTCLRLPGRYAVRGGLQLDICGGADVGFSYVSAGTEPGTPASGQTLPFIDLGPSVDLRAEANRVAVTLRGVGGVNIARQGFDDVTGTRVDVPVVSWRLELDFSWVMHDERADEALEEQSVL